MILFGAICICLIFAYMISHILYEKLYVNSIRDTLKVQVSQVALDYEGGELTDEFKEHVAWLNGKLFGEMVAVSNPQELNACLPYEVDFLSSLFYS